MRRYNKDCNKPGEMQYYIGDEHYVDHRVAPRPTPGIVGQ